MPARKSQYPSRRSVFHGGEDDVVVWETLPSLRGAYKWKSDGARSGLYGGGSTVQPNFVTHSVVFRPV